MAFVNDQEDGSEPIDESSDNEDSPGRSTPPYIVAFDHDSGLLHSFMPEKHKWEKKQRVPEETLQHHYSAIGMDNYVYVLMWNRNAHRLNLSKGDSQWERMPDMQEGHGTEPPVAVLQDYSSLFVVGANQCYETSSAGERFDHFNKKWEKLPKRESKLRGNALVSLFDSVYCIGGCDDQSNAKATVERYDPDKEAWTYVTSLIQPRYASTAVARKDKIYVIGGRCGARILSKAMEYYDPLTNTWTDIKLSSSLKFHFVACVLNEEIFAVETESQVLRRFNFEKQMWEEVESFPEMAIKFIISYQHVIERDLVVSKTTVIKPEGGTFNLPACGITFPENSFPCPVKVRGKVNFSDPKIQPFFPITPVLDLEFDVELQNPVSVKFENCCAEIGSTNLQAQVLRYNDKEEEWEILKEIALTSAYSTFETQKFSKISIGIHWPFFAWGMKINIWYCLYHDKIGQFHLIFTTNESAMEKISKKEQEAGFKRDFPEQSPVLPKGTKELVVSLVTQEDSSGDGFYIESKRTDRIVLAEIPRHSNKPFTYLLKTRSLNPPPVKLVNLTFTCMPRQTKESNVNEFQNSVRFEYENHEKSAQREIPREQQQDSIQDADKTRLEDIFQDEICKAFVGKNDFKDFARSKHGLKLDDDEVETICQDNNGSNKEMKMGLLRKWRQKAGSQAKPDRILEIVEDYRLKMNEEED